MTITAKFHKNLPLLWEMSIKKSSCIFYSFGDDVEMTHIIRAVSEPEIDLFIYQTSLFYVEGIN